MVPKLVSLRGGKEAKPKVTRLPVTFRCPPKVLEYVRLTSEQQDREQTEVIVSAIELDRDLAEKLNDARGRLEDFAESRGMSLKGDLAEVLAQLVRDGLESQPKRKR